MSDEKEVVPETNGKERKEEDNDDKDQMVEEPKATETNEVDDLNLEAEIIRQVEHYFGDLNLPRDKFLLEQTRLDDGWVPLELLTKFNRLNKLSTDIDVIEKALKNSKSGLLEIADKKIRRNPEHPLPEMNEERRKEVASRTIYAKGFPKDSTLDEILKFFKKFEDVENVIMRRYLDRRTKARFFKGSVFATFKTKAQADKFMESKDSIKYNDSNLLIMSQEEYGLSKQEEKNNRNKKKEKNIKKVEKPDALRLPLGTVLYFEDGHDKMTREEIKTAFTEIDKKSDIAFIDFKIGLTKGWIRFSQENAAVDFLKLLNEGNIEIGNHKVVLKLLEGEEEKEYLEKTVNEMSKRRKISKTFKQKNRGNFKGKYMKRRRENDNDGAPPAKVKCES